MILRSVFIVCLWMVGARAACPPAVFTPPAQVHLPEETAVFATHISTSWDVKASAKVGANAVVAYAKANGYPTVYLQDSEDSEKYYYSECSPTYYVQSNGGEFSFHFSARHVVSIGGYWERCQRNTVEKIMKQWDMVKDPQDVRITEVMNGTYMAGDLVRITDPYYEAYKNFLTAFGAKTINVFQFMEIVHDEQLEVEHIRRYLDYVSLARNYQIEIEIDGKKSFIKKEMPGARILTINFLRNKPVPEEIFID
jgi:hypothetical protein